MNIGHIFYYNELNILLDQLMWVAYELKYLNLDSMPYIKLNFIVVIQARKQSCNKLHFTFLL